MRIKITPEYSAQRKSHPINPALPKAISYLQGLIGARKLGKVCDLGCGKLRHLEILLNHSKEVISVDTEYQISSWHSDNGSRYIIRNFINDLKTKNVSIGVLSTTEFEKAKLELDVIFLINVTDVVTKATHKKIIESAYRNLKSGGLFAVIFPRNDASITKRFSKKNQYQDGHFFKRHNSVVTFMRNLEELTALKKQLKRGKFNLIYDGSRYKQVLLILKK